MSALTVKWHWSLYVSLETLDISGLFSKYLSKFNILAFITSAFGLASVKKN